MSGEMSAVFSSLCSSTLRWLYLFGTSIALIFYNLSMVFGIDQFEFEVYVTVAVLFWQKMQALPAEQGPRPV